jgi:hypothetical protein
MRPLLSLDPGRWLDPPVFIKAVRAGPDYSGFAVLTGWVIRT